MVKVTPTTITELKENEVFVFGSNSKGLHFGGAAKCAFKQFGAKWGQGIGMQGQSYAIPTLSSPMTLGGGEKLDLTYIGERVSEFAEYAKAHKDLEFLVTPIGCGIAGFTEDEIAPLFKCCLDIENVSLPQSFIDIIAK